MPSTRSRNSRRKPAATGCSGCGRPEKLGITGDAATAYAKEVVAADFEEAGDADVLRKVMADFAAKNVAVTEQAIRAKMNELIAVAAAEVKAGK
ncbi:hypothetical protein ACVWZK_004421 [Bradyrhizobium sp. GM0.4]